jgi:hypothetical protein
VPPAIAEQPEVIPLGYGRVHSRKVDDVLDPVREPLSALNKLRADMTPLAFSAQYQQRPIPLEGNIIKREWLRYFKGTIIRAPGDYFVISWDTAMKSSELADYSVGTVWHVQDRGRKKNLVDVVRGRFEAPSSSLRPSLCGESGSFKETPPISSSRTRALDLASSSRSRTKGSTSVPTNSKSRATRSCG